MQTFELIFAILTFAFIFIVFKIIYLEKNPFLMTRFWLIQLAVPGILFIGKLNLEMTLTIPYVVAFFFIVIVFKLFNWKKNPFRMEAFWITLIITGIVITVGGFLFFLCVLGEKRSPENNLENDIHAETITSVIIIQRKDTIQIHEVIPFLAKLQDVEQATWPVKYKNVGKIVFSRADGTRDSINTNGYTYGPYKGHWYQSEKNVLEEFLK